MSNPTNDLDELMNRDPLELSSQDIDKIIDYHRRQRARRASGEKTEQPKVNLTELLKLKPAAVTKIERRI